MRDYLQRLYGVGVLSVRSYVEQQKVTRLRTNGRYGYGKLRRPKSRKRMTVEMKEAFVWPEVPAEMDAYVDFFLPFSLFYFLLCLWCFRCC
jgi:large subunit ribosomal protein L23